MTLLEAVVAMVILSVVAIGCLEGTRGAARLQRRAQEVSGATMRAESELARAALGLAPGAGVQVERAPYGADAALDLVRVTVRGAAGEQVQLSRLVERVPSRSR